MFKDDFTTVCRAHHLSPKTAKNYWYFSSKFLSWLNGEDLKLDPLERLKQFLSSLANDCKLSHSTQAGAFHALKFLYEKVVGVGLGDLSSVPRATGQPRIVEVPDDNLARKLVMGIPGVHGTALRLIYGTGARLNDVLKLRVKDLDFGKGLVMICESKGGKSRLAPMPLSLFDELRQLAGSRSGDEFLFASSKDSSKRISEVTLQRAFAASKARLGIDRRYTIHSLRHAAAQYWERIGVDRPTIQTLLGHSSSKTTDLYLISGRRSVANVRTPI